MKIRIKGNSIRIRLTQSETAKFSSDGKLEDCIEFGLKENQRLTFSLIADANTDQVSAKLEDRKIAVIVPQKIVKSWKDSEEISITGEQVLSPDKTFHILIEKDFACLVPRASEDESDNFPYPRN